MHRRSIPSPAPSFFPTTTTLKAYGLLNSSITPFLSIISICLSIHLCSFRVWYPIFPISCALLTQCHRILQGSFVPLRDMHPLFHIRGSLFLPQGVAYPALGPIA